MRPAGVPPATTRSWTLSNCSWFTPANLMRSPMAISAPVSLGWAAIKARRVARRPGAGPTPHLADRCALRRPLGEGGERVLGARDDRQPGARPGDVEDPDNHRGAVDDAQPVGVAAGLGQLQEQVDPARVHERELGEVDDDLLGVPVADGVVECLAEQRGGGEVEFAPRDQAVRATAPLGPDRKWLQRDHEINLPARMLTIRPP